MKTAKITNRLVEDIDSVIRFLEHHRLQAARRLFPGEHSSYVEGWAETEPFRFWCRLDTHNRKRLVQLACEQYAELS